MPKTIKTLLTILASIITTSCSTKNFEQDRSWIFRKEYPLARIFESIDHAERQSDINYKSGCSFMVLLKVENENYQPITPVLDSLLVDENVSVTRSAYLSEGDISLYLSDSIDHACFEIWFQLEDKTLSAVEARFFIHEYFHFVHQGRAVKSNEILDRTWHPKTESFFTDAAELNKQIRVSYTNLKFITQNDPDFCRLLNTWEHQFKTLSSPDLSYWNSIMQGYEWPADYFTWQAMNNLGFDKKRFIKLNEDFDKVWRTRGNIVDDSPRENMDDWTTAGLFPNQYLFSALLATTSDYTLKQNQTLPEQMAPYITLCDESKEL